MLMSVIWGMKKSSLTSSMNGVILHHTYDRGYCYSKVYLYTYINDCMKMYVIVSYFTCIFIIKIVRVLLSFTPKNNELLYMVFRICREDT